MSTAITPAAELVALHERPVTQRVFDFAMVLRAVDRMPLDEDEYWERPWKWAPEYQQWVQAGCPWPAESGEPFDTAWELFQRAMEQEQ